MASPSDRPTIPDIGADPRVAELSAKLDGVRAQQRTISQDCERLQRERAERSPMSRASELAGAYLASGATSLASFEADHDEAGGSLERQLSTNARRLEVLARAERELEKNIAQATREFSAKTAREWMPSYDEKLRRIGKALGAVARTIEAEAAFQAEFERKGLSTGYLLPMPLTALGRIGDPGSRLSYYLDELRKRGVLTEAEIAAFSSPENGK